MRVSQHSQPPCQSRDVNHARRELRAKLWLHTPERVQVLLRTWDSREGCATRFDLITFC